MRTSTYFATTWPARTNFEAPWPKAIFASPLVNGPVIRYVRGPDPPLRTNQEWGIGGRLLDSNLRARARCRGSSMESSDKALMVPLGITLPSEPLGRFFSPSPPRLSEAPSYLNNA